jgi:UDP-2,3-diacylglucosamine pyrophosphatase LpxH
VVAGDQCAFVHGNHVFLFGKDYQTTVVSFRVCKRRCLP